MYVGTDIQLMRKTKAIYEKIITVMSSINDLKDGKMAIRGKIETDKVTDLEQDMGKIKLYMYGVWVEKLYELINKYHKEIEQIE